MKVLILVIIATLIACSNDATGTISNNNPISDSLDSDVLVYDNKKIIDGLLDTRDQQTYDIAYIGSQVWMAENLNYESDSGSFCYDDDETYCNLYGRLYSWDVAMTTKNTNSTFPENKGVCPDHWHIPSETEWRTLIEYIANDAGLTISDEDHWREMGNELRATSEDWKEISENERHQPKDSYGFSAQPGGIRIGKENYADKNSLGYWWSSSETGAEIAAGTTIGSLSGLSKSTLYSNKKYGKSIRCIQNAPAVSN